MDEITLDDQIYVSSKRAAQITGYAKDYVGQLCREGRVNARLVGRNWYVLETSIREHRFGVAPVASDDSISDDSSTENAANSSEVELEAAEIEPKSDWNSASYTTDVSPELLPILNSVEKEPEINVLEKYSEITASYEPTPASEDSPAVKEMQSAWHDWFARTTNNPVSPDVSSEETEEYTYIGTDVEEIEEKPTPITLEKLQEAHEYREEQAEEEVEEESFGDEEVVPIHRTIPRIIPTATPAPVVSHNSSLDARYSAVAARREVFSHANEPEGRIIRERRVRAKRKPSLVLSTVFLSVAGLAVIVTVLGSGMFDAFLSGRQGDYAPIEYLGGESTVIKAIK